MALTQPVEPPPSEGDGDIGSGHFAGLMDARWSDFLNISGDCTIDGVATSCNMAMSAINSGAGVQCPNNECTRTSSISPGGYAHFEASADGWSGYLPSGISYVGDGLLLNGAWTDSGKSEAIRFSDIEFGPLAQGMASFFTSNGQSTRKRGRSQKPAPRGGDLLGISLERPQNSAPQKNDPCRRLQQYRIAISKELDALLENVRKAMSEAPEDGWEDHAPNEDDMGAAVVGAVIGAIVFESPAGAALGIGVSLSGKVVWTDLKNIDSISWKYWEGNAPGKYVQKIEAVRREMNMSDAELKTLAALDRNRNCGGYGGSW